MNQSINIKKLKRIVADVLRKKHGCNCDLDKWEPNDDTGHSSVCRIDKIIREHIYTGKSLETFLSTHEGEKHDRKTIHDKRCVD